MSEKKTPWFPGDTVPARPGVYQRRFVSILYSKWTGTQWQFGQPTPDRAQSMSTCSSEQHRPWRGLAQEPKGEPK